MRIRLLALCSVLALSAIASAQKIQPSIAKDDGKLVTVKLALDNPDADYKPAQCAWYSFRAGAMLFIHQGCVAFQREFSEGAHIIVLILNGHSSKFTWNDQRSDVAIVTVQSRIKTEHTTFRPQDLAEMEAAAQKKKP